MTDTTMQPQDRDQDPNERSRRSLVNIALTVITVMLFIGAIGLAFTARSAYSSAADSRARVESLGKQRRQLGARERAAKEHAVALEALARKVPPAFMQLGDALDAVADAQNHVVDVHNHGATVYNAGNDAAAVAVYTGDGATAIADFTEKATRAQTAMKNADAATAALQEALND